MNDNVQYHVVDLLQFKETWNTLLNTIHNYEDTNNKPEDILHKLTYNTSHEGGLHISVHY